MTFDVLPAGAALVVTLVSAGFLSWVLSFISKKIGFHNVLLYYQIQLIPDVVRSFPSAVIRGLRWATAVAPIRRIVSITCPFFI